MSAKTKTPALRFKNFTEEWEESKLGEICLIGDIDHRMPQSVANGIPYLMTGDFIGINSLDFDNAKLISVEDYEQLSKKIKPEKDDILFARYASVGEVRYVETDLKFTISYSCAILKNKTHFLNSRYLFYFLKSNNAQNQVELEINTGSQRNIGIDSLKKIIVPLPINQEQLKISCFIKEVDTLIAQHQQKHDKLLNLKKALLEKMFPKQGETVPEIRFKGFSGEWEEKTLNHIVDIKSGRDYKHLSSGDIPVFGTGGYMLSVNEALSYDQDAIGIGRKGTIDKPYILNAPFWTVDTLFYAVPFSQNDLNFSYAVFQKINWRQKDESTGVPSLSKVAINGISVFTTNEEEQGKIGGLFREVDRLIAQHQAQMTKLGNIKQACLEKMFV